MTGNHTVISILWKITATISGLAALLIALTWVVLESDGVLVATTINHKTGDTRETHVWFTEEAGLIYLEAGSPDNAWVQDLAHNSPLTITGSGIDGDYDYRISIGRHEDIRRMMQARYGWRDQWVTIIFDLSRSQLVALTPKQPDS